MEGDVVGGTCVNRGCVPSKALLAVSGRMREMKDAHHLKALGIQVRQGALWPLSIEFQTKNQKKRSLEKSNFGTTHWVSQGPCCEQQDSQVESSDCGINQKSSV